MISFEEYCGPWAAGPLGGAGLAGAGGGGGLAWAGGGGGLAWAGGGGGLAWTGGGGGLAWAGGGLAWADSGALPKPSMTRTRAMVRVAACIERSLEIKRSTPLTPVTHTHTSTLRPNHNRIPTSL